MARPRKQLTDDQIDQIRLLAGYGLSQDKIARAIGIHPNTLRRTKKVNEQVNEALLEGQAAAEGMVGRSLFNQAVAGNVSAIIWYEKTRAGRHDVSAIVIQQEIEGQLSRTLDALEKIMTPDEYENLLRYLSLIEDSEEEEA